MKSRPLYQKIHLTGNRSFNILKVDRPYFVVPWHFHPEFEIMLVTGGTGTRFVGDSIEPFAPYDLVLVGSNLVHVWKNDPRYYAGDPDLLAEANVILFRRECFGKDFFNIPEMEPVCQLLKRAGRGLKFYGKTRSRVAEMIRLAYQEGEFQRFLSLMEILHTLAESSEYQLLSSAGYIQQIQTSDFYHLNIILDYLMKNYTQDIRLPAVAALANMSPTAFCRYFKSRTNKTLIQFVNELRIGHAKKMLIEDRVNISAVCFESGFNSISNFYEHFFRITGQLPLEFRKEHGKKIMEHGKGGVRS